MTTVEFALVAPAFLMMLLLLIDGARAVWTYQTLQEVASSSARRAATMTPTACGTAASAAVDNANGLKYFAVGRARAFNVTMPGTAITTNCAPAAADCNNMAGMVRVSINMAYRGASSKLLPSSMTTLRTASCFPRVS